MAIVLLLAAAASLSLSLVVSAQIEFQFPGNISNYLVLQGGTRNESDRLEIRSSPPEANTTSAIFYGGNLQNSNSQVVFSSNFVFQMLGGAYPFGFGAFVTTYNFPSCISGIVPAEIYSCEQFIVALNYDGTNKISLLSMSITNNIETLAVVDSNFSLTTNSTLQAWVEYHQAPHPNSIRLWLAEGDAPRPASPVLDYKLTYAGSYFFPGFIGCYNTNSTSCIQTVTSWSLSAGAPSGRGKSSSSVAWVTSVSVVSLAAAVLIVVAALVLVKRFRRRVALRKKALLVSNTLITYSFRELRLATSNFREVIGKGGSCTVYRGVLGSYQVAVKDMSRSDPGVEQQFFEELNVISQVRHHNLVALKGWCHEGEKLLLVYEFMSHGSLDKLLFQNSEQSQRQALQWTQRVKIIRSVAEGLNYLHEGLEKRIVHRDIKAANVLLDDRMNAKLGDFGLARLMHNTVGDQTMTKAGTLGYISPELAFTGRATEKSDVYGFGILVLEIVAGRRCVEMRFSGADEDRVVLLEWVWRMYEDEKLLEEVVDEKMNDVDGEEAVNLLKLGLLCCSLDAGERPSMRLCCQILSGEATLPTLAGARHQVSIHLLQLDDSSTTVSTSRIFQSSSF